MIEIITVTHQNQKACSNVHNPPVASSGPPRKQIQCSFRLKNILFSDEFAEQFSSLGNVANREVLNSGKAVNDEYFGQAIQRAFVVSNEEYNWLTFMDDEVFSGRDDIDPYPTSLNFLRSW
jgi:hypothetical protein